MKWRVIAWAALLLSIGPAAWAQDVPAECQQVLTALGKTGDYFFRDEPRMFYMHVHGHGKPSDFARRVKPALDLIGKGSAGAGSKPATPSRRLSVIATSRRTGACLTSRALAPRVGQRPWGWRRAVSV